MKAKTKKRLIRSLFVSFLLVLLLLIFRAPIYNGSVKYKNIGERKVYRITNRYLAEYIEQNMPDDKFSDIYVIKDIAQRLTSERLSFSLKAKESDPNKTFETGEANCIGYAAFTATVANHLIEKMYADNSWKAIPCKGKLYVFGSDIHQYTESRWFKDHDFVIFRNRESDSEIYADPTVSDYMGINEISKYKPEK